jgi:hypothetical protein
MKGLSMTNQNQLELGLAGANRCLRVAQRERRLNRANWWFDQMRQVVDRAFDWKPAPRFQLEQAWLTEGQNKGAAANRDIFQSQ